MERTQITNGKPERATKLPYYKHSTFHSTTLTPKVGPYSVLIGGGLVLIYCLGDFSLQG